MSDPYGLPGKEHVNPAWILQGFGPSLSLWACERIDTIPEIELGWLFTLFFTLHFNKLFIGLLQRSRPSLLFELLVVWYCCIADEFLSTLGILVSAFLGDFDYPKKWITFSWINSSGTWSEFDELSCSELCFCKLLKRNRNYKLKQNLEIKLTNSQFAKQMERKPDIRKAPPCTASGSRLLRRQVRLCNLREKIK